jgi:hypothetical protein
MPPVGLRSCWPALLATAIIIIGINCSRAARLEPDDEPQLLASTLAAAAGSIHQQSPQTTLVVYLYATTDHESQRNLEFFVERGVRTSAAQFVIIVHPSSAGLPLPELPGHASYVSYSGAETAGDCQWGIFGWLLAQETAQHSSYAHYIFITSAVKGPFLPAYAAIEQAGAGRLAPPSATG